MLVHIIYPPKKYQKQSLPCYKNIIYTTSFFGQHSSEIVDITPVKGEDYWTSEDKEEITAEANTLIATELAKRGQLKPEFAQTVADCTDTSKLYVLPDGFIYAYMYAEVEVGGYTNIADSTNSDFKGGYRVNASKQIVSGTSTSFVSPAFDLKQGDIIRMKGITKSTGTSGTSPQWGIIYYDSANAATGNLGMFAEPPSAIGCAAGVKYWQVLETSADGVSKWIVAENENGGNSLPSGAVKARIFGVATNGFENIIVTVNEEIREPEIIKEYQWASTGHAFVPADYEDRIVELESISSVQTTQISELTAQNEEHKNKIAEAEMSISELQEKVAEFEDFSSSSIEDGIVTPEKTTFIKIKEYAGEGSVEVPNFTNLANPQSSDWLTDKRTDGNGDIADHAGAFISNPFPVKEGDVIRIKGVTESGSAYFRFQPYTDTAGNTKVTSGIYFTKTTSQIGNGVVDAVTVKEGVTEWTVAVMGNGSQHPYVSQFVAARITGVPVTSVDDIIITINEELTYTIQGEVIKELTLSEEIQVPLAVENSEKINQLKSGARWFALGDSITEGWTSAVDASASNGYKQFLNTNAAQRWVNIVAEKNGYVLTNHGIGGTGYLRGDTNNARLLADTLDFSQCDFVTLAYGVNDWKYAVNIGSMNDDIATGGSMVANMRYVIKKILTDNPYCKIFVITPINCRSYGTYETNWGINYKGGTGGHLNGLGLQDIFDKMKEVCDYHGIELIDMTHSSVVNRENIRTVLADYVHPTVECHMAMARELARKIKFV